jgi:UDP:flavonoid glycosyltransferase YjiC (YdhE family)
MRLLFCASGATGHVLPMRPLCDALLQRGHEIAWVTSKTMASLLPMSQISLYQSTRDISFYRTKIIDAWPKSAAQSKREWSEQVLAPKLFALIADETCDCLRAIAERWKPDAIIYESCALAAPLVAAQLGLPSVITASVSAEAPFDSDALRRKWHPFGNATDSQRPIMAPTAKAHSLI